MLNLFLKIKYPQAIWSDDIFNLLKKNNIEKHIDNIYDIPGGAGFVSYNLSFKIDKKIHIIDIDERKIKFATKHINCTNVSSRTGDLYKNKFKNKSLWLLINSFYLLRNVSNVLISNSKQIEYIVGIFPYTDKKNYLFFKSEIDQNLNLNEMDKPSTIQYFEKNGYSLIDSKDTIFFNYLTHSKNTYVRVILSPLLFLYEKAFKPNGDVYWIGLFKRIK